MGTAEHNETVITVVPEAGKSIERKATQSSTTATMQTGGIDELLGNSFDTDNNAEDFVIRDTPQPQHRQSLPERVNLPTATPTISPVLTPSHLHK